MIFSRLPDGTKKNGNKKTGGDAGFFVCGSTSRLLPQQLRKSVLLTQASTSKSFIEAIHTTTSIDDLLFAGKERMAPTAHVNSDILSERRARFDLVAAAATSRNVFVTRMNICFHVALNLAGPVKKSADDTRAYCQFKS